MSWANRKAIELTESKYALTRYTVDLDEECAAAGSDYKFSMQDLFNPTTWVAWSVPNKGGLRVGDLMRVTCEAFEVLLCVKSVVPGSGVLMEIAFENSRPGTVLGNALLAGEAKARREELELLAAQVAHASNGYAQ
jgi:hypothetical protein